MGRKKMDPSKRKSVQFRIRMTPKERSDLERVAYHLNKNDSDVIRHALSWYYGSVLTEEEYAELMEAE